MTYAKAHGAYSKITCVHYTERTTNCCCLAYSTYRRYSSLKNTQHRCCITNTQHWWNAEKGNTKYCASMPVTLCPPHTPRGLPWDRMRSFAVTGWRLNIPAMAWFFSVHARHNSHTAGTNFQTWSVGHNKAICDPSQAICTVTSRSLIASCQRKTFTFHRNQYYNLLDVNKFTSPPMKTIFIVFLPALSNPRDTV